MPAIVCCIPVILFVAVMLLGVRKKDETARRVELYKVVAQRVQLQKWEHVHATREP